MDQSVLRPGFDFTHYEWYDRTLGSDLASAAEYCSAPLAIIQGVQAQCDFVVTEQQYSNELTEAFRACCECDEWAATSVVESPRINDLTQISKRCLCSLWGVQTMVSFGVLRCTTAEDSTQRVYVDMLAMSFR